MSEPEKTIHPKIEMALKGLAIGQEVARSCGRDDLSDRLIATESVLADPSLHVLVVGEFKQGKSSLVNALVGREICPVDDDIATAVPTAARWAAEPVASVIFHAPEVADEADDPARREPIREPIGLDEIPMYVVENPKMHERRVHSVDVGLPSRILRDGLVIVDTPGVGGLGSVHSTVTAGALPMAEAVVFVSDASQEFTAPEIEFMRSAKRLCPNLVCVMTKTDFYPAWRKIRDINLGHLDRLGIAADILAVSSTVYSTALKTGNADLLAESGYQELTGYIKDTIIDRAIATQVRTAANDLHAVADQLIDHFDAQKQALEDPESAQAKVMQLEAAKVEAEDLKGRAAKWQQTLNDGMQDLNADVDHDLRSRFRQINLECDAALAESDPIDTWSEFEPWLYRRTAAEVVANYQLLQSGAAELSERVASHFLVDDGGSAVDLDVSDPMATLGQVATAGSLDLSKSGIGTQAMTGLKGGYSIFLMFGAITKMASLALNPVGLGLSLMMGGKAIREDKLKQLGQRQSAAKAAQRKYIEEATFLSAKDSRDALRMIQRRIRDFYTTRASEHAVSVGNMLDAVKAAVKSDEKERSEQLLSVNTELKKLADFRQRVEVIGPRPKTEDRVAGAS